MLAAAAARRSSSWPQRSPTSARRRRPSTSSPRVTRPEIVLEPTPDILAALSNARRPGQVLVGFAAETHDVLAHGRAKLERKRVDLLVVNDVSQPGVGFDHDTNAVVILDDAGSSFDIPSPPRAQSPTPSSIGCRLACPPTRERPPAVSMRTTFTSESVTRAIPTRWPTRSPTPSSTPSWRRRHEPGGLRDLLTTGLVVVAGEVTTSTYVDIRPRAQHGVRHRLRQ